MGWAEPGVCALLISSSKVVEGGYLDHAEGAIRERLAGVVRVLFIPHALANRDAYAETARTRFGAMGFELDSLHEAAEPRAAVEAAEAVFVGGGNTFRLLKALIDLGVLASLRARVLPGASALRPVAEAPQCTQGVGLAVPVSSREALGESPHGRARAASRKSGDPPARRQSGRGRDGNRQTCHLSHPAPLFCDAPARGRL